MYDSIQWKTKSVPSMRARQGFLSTTDALYMSILWLECVGFQSGTVSVVPPPSLKAMGALPANGAHTQRAWMYIY